MAQWCMFDKQLYLMLPLHCHGQFVLLRDIVLSVDNLVHRMMVLKPRYTREPVPLLNYFEFLNAWALIFVLF